MRGVREGLKKSGKFHFGVWTTPPRSGKNEVIFFLNYTIFGALFVKIVFSPLKIPQINDKTTSRHANCRDTRNDRRNA